MNGKELFASLSIAEKKTSLLKGSIASAIYGKRLSLNMNQKEFAKHIGVSQPMISKWESGHYNWSIESMLEILDKLDIDYDMIIEGSSICAPFRKSIEKYDEIIQHFLFVKPAFNYDLTYDLKDAG